MVLYRKYIVCQLNRTSTRSPRRSMTSTLVMLWLVRGPGGGVALQPLLELAVVEVAGLAVEELLDHVLGDELPAGGCGLGRGLRGVLQRGHGGSALRGRGGGAGLLGDCGAHGLQPVAVLD